MSWFADLECMRLCVFFPKFKYVSGCCRANWKPHFNNGRTKEHFRFTTTLYPDTTIIPQTYKIVHVNLLQTVFQAQILKGEVFNVYTMNNVKPTGNITTGDFSFDLTNISASSSGFYAFQKPSGSPKCHVLYFLGKFYIVINLVVSVCYYMYIYRFNSENSDRWVNANSVK